MAETTSGPRRCRVAIAGGGTAGHVYPALATADAYRQMMPGVEVLFLGTADGFEARLVPGHGYRLVVVRAAPFFGVGVGGKMRAVWSMLAGALQARRLLRAEGVELVLGLGNYASAGALLGAWSLGVPTALHEANAVAGAANRLLGRFADRVLLGFESARGAFSAAKTSVTGIPVRPEILRLAASTATRPHEASIPFRVLVSGGSRGSRFLDERVPDLLARIAARGHAIEAWHQVGDGDLERTRAAYARAGVVASVVAYVDDIAKAYGWADFAVACAGAGTLAEVAAAGLPALLVPLSSAALDHQSANARAFAGTTGTLWTRERDWHPEALATAIASLIASPDAWRVAATGVRRFARLDAAAAVVAACEAAIRHT